MAIAYISQGLMSQEAIARKLHIDKVRIRAWVEHYNRQGLQGLEEIAVLPRRTSPFQD